MAARAGRLVAGAGLLLLAGCGGDSLFTGLSERDATQMIAVGSAAGLPIEKSSTDGGKSWSISVPTDRAAETITLLKLRGLPRTPHQSLGDIFKKDGFISSPTEERARFIFGTSQEIEEALAGIDGVIDVQVLLAIPPHDPLADVQTPPSASVLLKYDPAGMHVSPGEIKALVANSVDGLTYDHVAVILSPAQPAALGPVNAAVRRNVWLRPLVTILLAMLVAAAGWLIARRRLTPATEPAS